jgi:hypothetical protein
MPSLALVLAQPNGKLIHYVGKGDINTLAQDEMLLMPCPYKRPDLFLDTS